jgi:hypothetical protein
MKKTDFQTKEHNKKKSLEFPTKIKDKDQVLRAVLSLNSQKGTYDVTIKIGIDKVTGDDVLDKAMLKSVSDLTFHALKECQEFRKEWLTNQKAEDKPNLFDSKKDNAKKAAAMRVAKKPAKRKIATKK